MTDHINVVRLRNGAEEAEPLVTTLAAVLGGMFRELPGMLDVYELVMLARDRSHEIHGGVEGPHADRLVAARLLDRAHDHSLTMHGSTRNIVLSMFKGEGLGLSMVDPRSDAERSDD